jgi:hypothetical protein
MADDSTTESTRKRRTPAEIAQAELDKAETRFEKAKKRVHDSFTEYKAAMTEATRAERFVEFARQNPDLPGADAGDIAGQLTRNDGLTDDERADIDAADSED